LKNPLIDLLNARTRQIIYAVYFVAAIVIGAMAVGGVDIGKADDVLAYLAIPFGALAASNVEVPDEIVVDEPAILEDPVE
jgi:hydrogenase/urease accessory protein HupE